MSTDCLPFADRTDAGRRLAAVLEDRAIGADVVLAVPRGGLPVGRAVADALGVPLDVVARKFGAPGNPELAPGAVAADGTAVPNDDRVGSLHLGRDAGNSRVVLAVPVAPSGAVERLEAEADAVVCVARPANFGAVGQFYRSFDQVPDEAAMAYLDGDDGPP